MPEEMFLGKTPKKMWLAVDSKKVSDMLVGLCILTEAMGCIGRRSGEKFDGAG
jgi:hypothetical protein